MICPARLTSQVTENPWPAHPRLPRKTDFIMPTSTDNELRDSFCSAMGTVSEGGWVACRTGHAAILVFACMLFSACGTSNSHESAYSPPPQPHAASVVETASGAVATERSDEHGRSIRETCGEATVVLQCSGKDCTRTSLQLMTAHGPTLRIANPSGLGRYSAVGLGCAVASDQTPYVVVQYGELPTGCEFCEWFHVLDAKGQWLTHSVPAILTDRTLPIAHDRVPNNVEFNAFSRKWKLGKPHVKFIQ